MMLTGRIRDVGQRPSRDVCRHVQASSVRLDYWSRDRRRVYQSHRLVQPQGKLSVRFVGSLTDRASFYAMSVWTSHSSSRHSYSQTRHLISLIRCSTCLPHKPLDRAITLNHRLFLHISPILQLPIISILYQEVLPR